MPAQAPAPDPIWNPGLENCHKAVMSSRFGALLSARLLQLGADGKVAIEALKLLVTGSSGAVSAGDSELAIYPVEVLVEAYERADSYIKEFASGPDGAAALGASAGPGVISALRPTDHAAVPGGAPSSVNHGGAATGGEGLDPISDHFDAPASRKIGVGECALPGVVSWAAPGSQYHPCFLRFGVVE